MEIVNKYSNELMKNRSVLISLRMEDIIKWIKKSPDNFTLYKDVNWDNYHLIFRDKENLFYVVEKHPYEHRETYSMFLIDWLLAFVGEKKEKPSHIQELNRKYDIDIVEYEGIRY